MADQPSKLSALDWVVIIAATVSLVVLLTWLVQGRTPQTKSEPETAE